ncbi:putative PurR-regulated permease PerM [Paenibacillus turicensis]|uniref:PurR-regulated permease PerM n=1 Tax=Paenibacillus turicensis TaxID=160487 RepID=A0ABS4FSS8_9BACL|nr:AI-2E family transporter [Paenibacillus turicensis]MBP1905619.1 putative PurR-regulated permease PerM [Paenibacillus turicensis]
MAADSSTHSTRNNRFFQFFINNRLVVFLLILLLIGLNIFIFSKISFIFNPLTVFIKTILFPILLTGALYYLLNPLVNILEKRKIPRVYTIIALYLSIALLITLLLNTVIPLVQEQINSLILNFPRYSQEVQIQFESLVGSDLFGKISSTSGFDPSKIGQTVADQATSLFNGAVSGLGGFIGAVKDIILTIATIPFILFYLLKDGKKLPGFILRFVPVKFRKQSGRVMAEMNDQISSYIRGQIIVSMCIGLLLYIGFLIIGIEYSLVLAIIAACTSIVPYLGPAIAITPALIIAIVTSPMMLLKLIVVWTVAQFVEGKFISPQIMGKTLKIHPITIIFVILTAGNLFGFLGIILAVPGYAVLKVICTHLFHWFERRTHLYDEEPELVEMNENENNEVVLEPNKLNEINTP